METDNGSPSQVTGVVEYNIPRTMSPALQQAEVPPQPLDFNLAAPLPPESMAPDALSQLRRLEQLAQELYQSESNAQRDAAQKALSLEVLSSDALFKCQVFLKYSTSQYLLVHLFFTHTSLHFTSLIICFFFFVVLLSHNNSE